MDYDNFVIFRTFKKCDMKAFGIYHPTEVNNDSMRKEFIRRRLQKTNYVRWLYIQNHISLPVYDELKKLVKQCNYEELVSIDSDIRNITRDGVTIEHIRNKISEKPPVPANKMRHTPNFYVSRDIMLQGLTEQEINERRKWIARAKRVLRSRFMRGTLPEAVYEQLKSEVDDIRTAHDAEQWYIRIRGEIYERTGEKHVPYCEQCPHCQRLKDLIGESFSAVTEEESSDSE